MTTEARTTRTEHPHIVMTPGTCGGRPRIDGTRLSVEHIVRFTKQGSSPEAIMETYPEGYVTLAAVYDALSFYHDHKEQLDREIEENSLEAQIARGEISVDEKGRVTFLTP